MGIIFPQTNKATTLSDVLLKIGVFLYFLLAIIVVIALTKFEQVTGKQTDAAVTAIALILSLSCVLTGAGALRARKWEARSVRKFAMASSISYAFMTGIAGLSFGVIFGVPLLMLLAGISKYWRSDASPPGPVDSIKTNQRGLKRILMNEWYVMIKPWLGNIGVAMAWPGRVLLLLVTSAMYIDRAWASWIISILLFTLSMIPRDKLPPFLTKHRTAVFFILFFAVIAAFPEHLPHP